MMLIGSFGLFFSLFCLFCRFLTDHCDFGSQKRHSGSRQVTDLSIEIERFMSNNYKQSEIRWTVGPVRGPAHTGFEACNQARRLAGYKKMDAYSPFPVHGIDPAIGIKRTSVAVFSTGDWFGRVRRWIVAAVLHE